MIRGLIARLSAPAPIEPVVADPPRLDLFYWRARAGVNFGDYLSSVVVAKLAAERGFFVDEQLSVPRRLLAIGSILHFARDGDIVWGSGVNGKVDPREHVFDRLDVRAVRGPLTRAFLMARGIDVPAVYGDPALLLPRLLAHRFARSDLRRGGIRVLPNLHDLAAVADRADVISPLDRWSRVIDAILAADFIVASSLHGLVVADAFGVPCRYVRLSETEDLFKYRDYALGAGRGELDYASSIGDAIAMGPMPPVTIDTDALLAAFPYDIWTDA